jgi:hypothetical protein
MKLGFVNIAKFAAVVVSMVIAASVNAHAVTCPTSPYYSPDFTANGSCLTLNPSASIPTPAGSASTITGWTSTTNTVTFTTASSNGFVVGEPVILSGFINSTFFNTLVFPVQSVPTTSSFTVAFVAPSSPTSGVETAAVATPMTVLQLTPNSASQAGSAWDMTPQTVGSAFSTTFYFQLSPSPGPNAGDGFAFVIQNSPAGTAALGPDGCDEGFGEDTFIFHDCGTSTAGIPNSIAVSFKTSLTSASDYPDINSVSIQNNNFGSGVNCVDKTCTLAENDLSLDTPPGPKLTDGAIHAATVTYSPTPTAAQTSCVNGATRYPCLDVILDGVDLFPTGVPFDLTVLGLATGNTAWVGFTAGTSTNTEAADILSWVFTPAGASNTGPIQQGTQTNFNFQGGYVPGNTTGYNFNAELTAGNAVSAVVTSIPIKDQPTCDGLLANSAFSTAKCFVYQNAGGPGIDQPVMFELTCPPAGECNSGAGTFPATLGSEFPFLTTDTSNDNQYLYLSNFPSDPLSLSWTPAMTTAQNGGYPAVGLLKGQGPDPIHPCTPFPAGSNIPLFQSNQIASFTLDPDTSGGAKGQSGDTNSCWVVTYLTPNELPTVTVTAPSGNYPLGGSIDAAYSCSATNNSPAVTGPYLTVTQCTGPTTFDTSATGSHTYTAYVTDSALNSNYQTVTYYVQEAPVFTNSNGTTTTFTVGTPGTSFVITTTGYPVPSLSSGTLPGGLSFKDNGDGTGTISGTPNAGTGGSYNVQITASNTTGTPPALNSPTEYITVVVDQAPAILTPTVPTIPTFTGGTPGSIGVTTSGYPVVNSISLSAAAPTVTLPSWLTIGTVSNTGTATISVNPPLSISQTTQVTFTITASNGVSPNAAQTFTLTVNPGSETVTISPSIPGLSFVVDGTTYTSYSQSWTIGLTHTLSAATQISGKTEYTFQSSPVAGQPSETVTATAGTTSYTVYFNTLYQLTTAANPVGGGTVTPAAGGPYYLAGSQPSVVAAQAAGYAFSSWTGPVTSSTSASTTVLPLTAPVTVTANFTALPPTLTIYPTSLNFGNVNNNTSKMLQVTLTNNGATAIKISSIKIPGSNTEGSAGDADDYSFVSFCGSSILAGKSCLIDVTFSADNDYLSTSAQLVITDNAAGSPQPVGLSANVLDPLISLSSSSMSFGTVTPPATLAKTVTVKNSGLTSLTLSGLSISGTYYGFTTPPPANSCTNSTVLTPGGTCIVGVTFAPATTTKSTSYSGTVTITSNALNGATKTISLSGTGK